MTWNLAPVLYLKYNRQRINMAELAKELGYSLRHVNNVAASGGLPVKTYLEHGRRWADLRDLEEYFNSKRGEAA